MSEAIFIVMTLRVLTVRHVGFSVFVGLLSVRSIINGVLAWIFVGFMGGIIVTLGCNCLWVVLCQRHMVILGCINELICLLSVRSMGCAQVVTVFMGCYLSEALVNNYLLVWISIICKDDTFSGSAEQGLTLNAPIATKVVCLSFLV